MITIIKKLLLYGSIAAISFVACSRENKNSIISAPANPAVQGTQSIMHSSAGTLTVKILPEMPTVVSDLNAVVAYTGSGQVAEKWERNGQMIEGENSPVLFSKKRFVKGDRITVTITADGESASATVEIKNSLPVVTSLMFSPEFIYRGVDITASPVGFDADGDLVRFTYKWSVNGEELSEITPVMRGDRFKRGDRVSLVIIPYDNEGEGVPFISKPIIIPNAPPHFVSTPPAEFQAETYVYQAVAEDPDGDILTYSLVSAPQGMTIDARTGMITMKIMKEHAGTHPIEIVVQDPEGTRVSQQYSLTLTMPRGENEKQ